uniref:Thioesterase n=1 Tax=Podospora anserina (strain S / ATCC MYA-4624 / DSM 980 / FGSC 10383) TaxID=515849 RepID=A0A090CJ13_PODAN|nr:Putative Thioesterase [Podospora anserina S mat+]
MKTLTSRPNGHLDSHGRIPHIPAPVIGRDSHDVTKWGFGLSQPAECDMFSSSLNPPLNPRVNCVYRSATKMTGVKLQPTRFVRSVLKSFMAESGLEPRVVKLRVVNASKGRVDLELDITKDHTNRLKIIHGGTIASLVDLGGSLAVASEGLYATGVSTDLNVTYLKSGGKVGDKLQAVAECEKIGPTLAFTKVTFTNPLGELVARGSHTKYVKAAWKGSHPYTPPEGAEIADEVD